MPTAKIECAVIGGGIIALSSALALQERGLSVTVIAPGSMVGTASWGNAGHVAVEQVEPLASMDTIRSFPRRLFWRGGALSLPPRDIAYWLPFSLRLLRAARPSRFRAGTKALTETLAMAMPAWRRLVDTLEAPDLLQEAGHFILWENARTARAGRDAWAGPQIGTTRVRGASPQELAHLAAHLPFQPADAIRFSGSGQIADMDQLACAMEARFRAQGGERRDAHVIGLTSHADGTVALALDDGAKLQANAVLVAAGAASGELMRPLGHRVPIIAERGYHIQAPASRWPEDMPPVVFEDRSMIVTRFRGTLRAASFVEFGALSSPPDPRKWARLRRHAAELGLPFDTEPMPWMGARPTLPDYLPAIGRSRRAANLFYAFGHQHLGLTLGPLTGEAVAAIMHGKEPAFDLTPFDLKRFG